MRLFLKFLHTLASCGLIGALLGYAVVLTSATAGDAASYAETRHVIASLCNWVLLPSLAVALVTGLFSMVVHRPFQERRWVWAKAALGISMFEATLGFIQSKANYAAGLAKAIAAGEAGPEELAQTLVYEWYSLGVILALSVANIALGVWRPALKRRPPIASPEA